MNTGDLTPTDGDRKEPASSEVQFALVIARMIDTVHNSPEHMRQAVYDLARYKLQEQFTHADAKDIKWTQEALESAIRGVEQFSQQHIGSVLQSPAQKDHAAAHALAPPDSDDSDPHRAHLERKPVFVAPPEPARPRITTATITGSATSSHPLWSPIKRIVLLLLIIGAGIVAVQQRERVAAWASQFQTKSETALPAQPPLARPTDAALTVAPPPKPKPLRPADYGIYAIGDDSLAELQLLPGRPPDVRVAVSAALKVPPRTVLPNGRPRFIVFRRDAATNVADRAEVRVMARIAREFSAEAAGKKPDDGDDTWVIRNVTFPFRSSPVPDSPEMYELHSEDPALELPPGRYALILKSQAYDFIVNGQVTDPRQCIERVVTTSGTFYTDCKKP